MTQMIATRGGGAEGMETRDRATTTMPTRTIWGTRMAGAQRLTYLL